MSTQQEEAKEKKFVRYIDIDKALSDKSPTLLKLLPGFIIRYIKRIIHQEELNGDINDENHNREHDFVDSAVKVFGPKVISTGGGNIPKEGSLIMASNHPMGALDGIAFMDAAGDFRKDIRFFVNDLLLQVEPFGKLFVPINKHGANSSNYVNKMEEAYASDKCKLIFPAGMVSRLRKNGEIKDLVWKRSFIEKAIKYKTNVVPVYTEGRNTPFFYKLGYWRKKLGIKANLEMFYLVDELYKQKGKTITINFGKPISWKTFTTDKPAEYWSEKVKQHVYAMQSGDKSKMLPTI